MNILDPRFKYVNSVSTDVRKTFARVRKQAREATREVATGPALTSSAPKLVSLVAPSKKVA